MCPASTADPCLARLRSEIGPTTRPGVPLRDLTLAFRRHMFRTGVGRVVGAGGRGAVRRVERGCALLGGGGGPPAGWGGGGENLPRGAGFVPPPPVPLGLTLGQQPQVGDLRCGE